MLLIVTVVTTCMFLGGNEPSISIESIKINGTILQIGIAPNITGLRCERCILIETSQQLSSKDIDSLETQHLVVGTSINGIFVLTDSTKPTWIDKVVSSHGVKGMDSFEFDLSKIHIVTNKHYYALAVVNDTIYSSTCIDHSIILHY